MASSGDRTIVVIEDETAINRYSATVSQICKNCKMLIKSRLCIAGIELKGKKKFFEYWKAWVICSIGNMSMYEKLLQPNAKLIFI